MGPRLQALLAVVLWGLSFVATRMALRELSPFTLVFTRFAMGLALLSVMQASRPEGLAPPRGALLALALMGFVGMFFHLTIQAYALTLTTAVKTGWLIGIIPVWSALIAVLFLRERLGGAQVVGLVLGFGGAALIVTRGAADGGLAVPSTTGDLIILASTLNWAIYTAMSGATIRRVGSLRATTWAMAFGLAMLAVPFVIQRGWSEWPRVDGAGWAAVAFLGFGCSGLGYLLWNGALKKIPSSSVAAFLYLEPLVTLAAAVPLLGEPVNAATIAGGVIVLAGVALVQRATPPQRAAA